MRVLCLGGSRNDTAVEVVEPPPRVLVFPVARTYDKETREQGVKVEEYELRVWLGIAGHEKRYRYVYASSV